MSRTATRFGIIAMLLALGVTIVYVLSRAAGGPGTDRPFEKFAEGPLEKLDFAYAGEVPDSSVFQGPAGENLTLADLKGKIVLVNFWATWCGPCEREMPSLGALQTALGSDAFSVVAVSVDNDEDVTFAKEQLVKWTGGTLDFYHTPEFALTYDVGVRGFPTSIIYDVKGAEVARLSGELDWSSVEAVGFIRAILEKSI